LKIKLKRFNKKSWIILQIIIFTLITLFTFKYISFFHEALENSIYQNVNGYTRIVTPDTFLYKNIINTENVLLSIILSGVKNSLGTSFMWYLSSFNWYVNNILNIFFILLIVLYTKKLLLEYNVQESKIQLAILSIIILPSTIFYSIGSLKEIPTALLFIMILYYYKKIVY